MFSKLYNSVFFEPAYFLLRKFFLLKEFFIRYSYKKRINPTLPISVIRNYNKNRITGPNKIICLAPFKHMYFKQNGKITACCATSVDAYGNINDDSIANIWKGENANKLRNRISNYNLSGGCAGCQYSLETKNYNAFIGRIYDELLPSQKSIYPTEMTFEISNTCNLECIMCNGGFSNLIRKNIENLPDIPDYYNEHFFEEIKEFLPHLKRVRFMGGEPFLIKQYQPIMEFLVKENPDCIIHIQTNGTILNNAVKQIIESKNVEVSISVDSLHKETYEKIRINSNFERAIQNLNYFSKRAKDNQQLININFCIMNNNWKEVPDIVLFCERNNFTLNLIPVENPRSFSLRILKYDELSSIYNFSQNKLVEIKGSILRDIYNGYLNHIDFLMKVSKENEIKFSSLFKMTFDEVYKKAKLMFVKIHHKISIETASYIFDDSCKLLASLKDENKKRILANLILDIERINEITDNIDTTSKEELMSKTKVLFEQMKLEEIKYLV